MFSPWEGLGKEYKKWWKAEMGIKIILTPFLQSSELGFPHSVCPLVGIGTVPPRHPQASVHPPPFGSGVGYTLACGEGVRRSQFQRWRQTLWYSRCICTLWLGLSKSVP
jgi:hypothetical protein